MITVSIHFPIYKRKFIFGQFVGDWEKIENCQKIEVGDKSTQSMLIDGSGYYINDLENNVQYFVDYEVNKAPKQLKRP